MRDLSSARIQPAPSAEVARVGEIADAGVLVPALLITAPARLTWPVRFGEHADLDASVALVPGASASTAAPAGVTVRIGISDGRTFDELGRLALTAASGNGSLAWHPIRIDLGAYVGWKFSVFYRPSRLNWNIVVSADATPGGTLGWRALRIQAHAK
jgi:hypothetical protein